MWKEMLVNKMRELGWGFNMISLAMKRPKKGIFKVDDFKKIRGIIGFASYAVMSPEKVWDMKISLFDLVTIFYPICIN